MSELERKKIYITREIRGLCAHCSQGVPHKCRVQNIAEEVARLSGVPLMVNDSFSGLLLADLS